MTPADRPPDLTLQEAADQLGVHYMTAYRYVRTGRLAATKQGAVWRVRPADLDAMRAETERPRPGRHGTGEAPGEHWAKRLEARLVAGDGVGTMAVVETAMGAGIGLDDLYLEVISPAMASIGYRWAIGELDIADEHRASVLVYETLGRLAARFARPGRSRGTVVLGAAPGETHALPVTLLAGLLRARGFAVDNLGADVPARSFRAAAAVAERLVAVGISVTREEHLDGARAAVVALRALAGPVHVLVGGNAVVDEAVAWHLGADGWASSGAVALELVEALPPPPTGADVSR
jgi:excisionase family DNA binding protein